jgi:SAM-dependent methyltransferase
VSVVTRPGEPVDPDVSSANVMRWQSGDYVADFAHRLLRPVEVVLLARYREALTGRVLELGCGAGRILGYLLELGAEANGIDVSPRMVEYCHERYPTATVVIGDMTKLPPTFGGVFDAIVASYNVLDVLDDAARRELLADLRVRLTPDSVLIFSSHNLAYMDAGRSGSRVGRALSKLNRPVSELAALPFRLPTRLRNRRRMGPLERREADHAMLNDEALDYALLHYYIRRSDEARQLEQLGYELVECLDLDGRTVARDAPDCPELHYVARRR